MGKFFISDLHLLHQNILLFAENRIDDLGLSWDEFNEVKEAKKRYVNTKKRKKRINRRTYFRVLNTRLIDQMNEKLIDKINRRIKKSDILYVLGDVFIGPVEKAKKLLAKIKCRKILILGNHDRSAKVMLEMGFDDVFENKIIKITDGKTSIKVLLSHYPYYPTFWAKLWYRIRTGKSLDLRYLWKRSVNRGMVLLHGHTHDKAFQNGNQIHVGCESLNCMPISEKELVEYIKENV